MKSETRRDGTVQLADWWEDLLWPRVLTAAALGIRPGRIGLAFFGIVMGLVIVAVGLQLDRWIGRTQMPLPSAVLAGPEGPLTALTALWRWMIGYPIACVTAMPFTTILAVVLILPLELVVCGAISRLVALECAHGEFSSWTAALAFSIMRFKSLLGAIIGPLAVVWCVCLLLGGAGWLLLNWPYVNLLGSVLYLAALLLAIGSALIGIVYIVGHGLLVPAVVCDGADAIDAIQRAYAYTLDRPIRLIAYLLLAATGLAFVLLVIGLILGAGIGIAYASTGFWLDGQARDSLLHGTLSAIPGWEGSPESLGGTWGSAAWVIRLWTLLPVFGFLACVLSGIIACDTVVYMAIRRICDGQDTAELWTPGMIEGVMSDALKGRAAVSRTAAVPVQPSEPADEP